MYASLLFFEGQYFGKFLPWDSLLILLDLRLESSYRLHNTWNKIVHQPHLLFKLRLETLSSFGTGRSCLVSLIGANSCHKKCDIPPWVAKNLTTHPLSTAQKRMTHKPSSCFSELTKLPVFKKTETLCRQVRYSIRPVLAAAHDPPWWQGTAPP